MWKFLKQFFELEYFNEIHYIKELQKTEGLKKLQDFKESLTTKAKISTIKLLISFLLLFTLSQILKNIFPSSLWILVISLHFVTISNTIAIIITKYYISIFIDSFLGYCNSIIKFEDYSKVIMKIKQLEKSFLNLLLTKLITDYPKYSESFIDKNEEVSSRDTKLLWDNYLKRKFAYFNFIFDKFEKFFMNNSTENKINKSDRYFFSVLINLVEITKTIHNIKQISSINDDSLRTLKEKYSNLKFFDINEEFEETKIIVENICENVKVFNENTNYSGNTILRNNLKNLNNVIDNLSQVLQNSNSYSNYLNLIQLIFKIRDDYKDSQNFIDDKDKALELFETLIERNFALINVLKQIKLNFTSSIEPIYLDLSNSNLPENIESKLFKDLNCYKQTPSLIELELPKPNVQQLDSKKKEMTPVSYFEIMKREDDLRKLQMFLLSDLEEFQKRQTEEQWNNEENQENAIILESVLD